MSIDEINEFFPEPSKLEMLYGKMFSAYLRTVKDNDLDLFPCLTTF